MPNEVSDALNIREGSFVRIYVEGGRAVIEPVEDVVEKFKGSVSVERWPEDLDDFLLEILKKMVKRYIDVDVFRVLARRTPKVWG